MARSGKNIILYYYDKFKRKIEFNVHPKDFKDVKTYLLEASHSEDIGDIYMLDEHGNEIMLDYYND